MKYFVLSSPARFLILSFGLLLLSVPSVSEAANPCGDYQSPTTPTGYGSAYNHFSGERELTLEGDCGDTGFTPYAGSFLTDQTNFAVYNQGYYWSGTAWRPFTFTPISGLSRTSTNSTAWIIGPATTNQIPYQGATTYFVAYTCHFGPGQAPKCGCSDSTCATPKWQVQKVTRPVVSTSPTNSVITNPANTSNIYFAGEYPRVAVVKRAGPNQLVVEVDDSIIRQGVYNESTRSSSGLVKEPTPWSSPSWNTWQFSGSQAGALSLTSRYSVPNQMNGGTRALRHKVLLTINRPLIQGETITLKPQTGGETLTAQVSDTMLSAVISVPHHGWTTNSLDKKAFIGGWYGVPITGFSANTQWGIVDATTGKFVSGWGYTNNKPSLRVHRSANQLFTYSSSINNFTLRHDYWEADFSTLTSPGKYQVVVQGYGASVPFEISNNVHLPLVRHTMRGLMHLAHGYEYRAQSGLLGYTQPTFKYVAKVVSGATAASWSPDGIGNQGKIWEGPRGATLTEPGGATMVVREDDSVLKNFLPDDIVEGYRDAADYDIRPQHLMMLVDMTTVAMAYPWLSQQDFGRAEPAVYNKVVRGTRISGSRALSDFDQSILHGVDAWARMQLISKAGSWVPTAMPSNLGNWAGAVRGGFEMGAYLGWDTNFMSWARNPKQPNNQYVLYFLRPDPWSTYAAAAAFGATALRMKQIGDPVLEEYYRDRAVAAWNWAIDNEDRNYTYNGRVAWSTSWRSDREFQESKATAAVALWLLTGTQSYHQVYTSVTNHDDMTGVDRTVAARLYYIASKNPALGSGRSFSDSVLTQIERDAKSTLSTLSQRLNSSATSLFYRPEGYGFSNPNFQNSPPSPRYAELVYHPLMMMYDALSVTEKQQLRRMLDAEVSQMAGRNPDNRPYVTGFGYDPTRDVMIGDWGGTGLRVVPPGLVALELLSNEKISSSDTDGYTVNGVENPAAIPFLHRRVMGRGVASTIGEFQVDTSIWPSILAPIVAHELGRQN